jgi:multicomponent Na+:H+ antiporter subunit B
MLNNVDFINAKKNILTNRDSIHFVKKNVNEASKNVNNKYFTARNTVKSKPVELGEKDYEDGSANLVTSIVVHYRGFDTLAELTILFAAITSAHFLIRKRRKKSKPTNSIIVKSITPLVFGLTFILGFYIIIHGHLTPGGGFPGGAIIASGVALLFLISTSNTKTVSLKIIESIAGISYVTIGFAGLIIKGSFLANFLKTGNLGELFSSGIVVIIYILIGVKVATELSSLVLDFKGIDND